MFIPAKEARPLKLPPPFFEDWVTMVVEAVYSFSEKIATNKPTIPKMSTKRNIVFLPSISIKRMP